MIPRFSVKRPYTVVVGVVLIIILGFVSFTSMQTDLLPEMTLPYAIVYTTYPGASPEEVETVVTRPVEQAMATTSNIETINSVSSENISMVVLQFSQSANMDAVTIEMRESLDQIESYWDDSIGSPIIMKLNPDMLPVMVAAMEAGDMTQSELTDLVNNQVLPELESIEGVASVSAAGTIEEQVQVVISQEKIDAVNEKVKNALDKKFEEAEEELQEAQDALTDGKSQLEQGQEALASQMGAAESQLSSGTSQMITGELQIDQKLAEVEAGLAQLDASEQELLAKEKELLEGEAALQELPAQKEALAAQQTQLASAISQLESAPTQLAGLEVKIAQLDAEIGALQAQIEALGGASLQDEEAVLTQASDEAVLTAEEGSSDDMILEEDASVSGDGTESSVPSVAIDSIVTMPDTNIGDIISGSQQATTLAQLQTQLAQKQAEKASYESAKQQAYGALHLLGVNTSGDYLTMVESIDTVKSELVTRRTQVDDGLATLQTSIDGMSEQMTTITQGKAAIEEGKLQIASGRAQLEAARTQLTGAKEQITSGQSTAAEAVAQLNSAQIAATIEMAVGKAEIIAGQKELDAALEQIDTQKESAYDQADVTQIVTADLVKGILAAQNFSMPAGYVTEDGTDFLVRVGNKFSATADIEDLMLLDLHIEDLEPIYLKDVADVTIIDDSDTIYASVNGRPGVMFTMQKQSGYSTGSVSGSIKEKFEELESIYTDVHIIELMDQGIYIDLVVDSVLNNMLSGGVLAVIVLLVFLKSLRPTFVIACSIPISIMTAIVLMYFSGINLNIISLSGLALGIGMLVDNSIVVIENIYRLRAEGYSVKKAAVEGANQVAGAIASSTLTTVCVFLPIVFTEGITRQLFVDMGLTIGYSLIASLVVALTLVPMMGAGLLKNGKEKRTPLFSRIQNGYAVFLRGALKVKFLVVLLAIVLLGASGYLAVSRGTAFMPEMESTQISITVHTPEGSTLQETGEISDQVMARIRELPDVTDVGAMSGGSSMNSMMGGSESDAEQATMYVLLTQERTTSNDELTAAILENTADLNCELSIETATMDMSALGGSGISIKIKGRELDQLKRMAAEIAALVESVEGTQNVSDGIEEKTLEFRLVVDKDKAMSYQLTTAQIYQFLQQKLADASSATTLSTLSKDYDVLVVSDRDETLTRDRIKKLTIEGMDEENKTVDVPVSELVEFQNTEGFSSINREAQTRYVTVTAEIAEDYNIGLVAADVQEKLDAYEVPKGYSIEMAGEDETINEAMYQVLKMLALAVVFMYLIMVAQFQSLLSPFIVMFTIPLAFTGGFFALYLADSPVSVIAMIGFVMLSGIIVNNGIVLVDYINQLRRAGMDKKEAIIESGRTRLRPIIMTALTTILGLLPMAYGSGMGADMVQPMAIVTVGGLVYGTLLTLFVVPCIYDMLNRNKSMVEEEF